MKRTRYFVAGLLTGAVLFGGSVAYAAGVIAERITNTIYIDGQRMERERLSDLTSIGTARYKSTAPLLIPANHPRPPLSRTARSVLYAIRATLWRRGIGADLSFLHKI